MLKQMIQKVDPGAAKPDYLGGTLMVWVLLGMLSLGAWQLGIGLSRTHEFAWNSNAWLIQGTLTITGTFACAWLTWLRFAKGYNCFPAIMLVCWGSNVAADAFRDLNQGAFEGSTLGRLGLTGFFLIMLIVEEIRYHKQQKAQTTSGPTASGAEDKP